VPPGWLSGRGHEERVAPRMGLDAVAAVRYPGRYPGLACCGAFGLDRTCGCGVAGKQTSAGRDSRCQRVEPCNPRCRCPIQPPTANQQLSTDTAKNRARLRTRKSSGGGVITSSSSFSSEYRPQHAPRRLGAVSTPAPGRPRARKVKKTERGHSNRVPDRARADFHASTPKNEPVQSHFPATGRQRQAKPLGRLATGYKRLFQWMLQRIAVPTRAAEGSSACHCS